MQKLEDTKVRLINRRSGYKYARTYKGKFANLKRSAKSKGRGQVLLNFEEYAELVVGKVCNYCSGSLPEMGHGLDRLNNKLGYQKGNVVPCCADCNQKKGYLEAAGFEPKRTQELMKELLCQT